MLFVHGFGCDMDVWEKQFEGFCEDDIRLLFIDLPGFGNSDKLHTDYTLDYFAQAVESVLEAEKINRVILIGHSLGTPICLRMVQRGNVSIVGLCDVDGVYCLYPQDSAMLALYEEAVQGFAESFCGCDVKQNITDFVYSLAGPDTPQEIVDYSLSTMPNTPDFVACSSMSHLIDHKYWDDWEKRQVCIPALVVCTKNSGIAPDNQEQMKRFYSNMTYWELDACGHFIMWEQSDEFNRRLHGLVGKIDSAD